MRYRNDYCTPKFPDGEKTYFCDVEDAPEISMIEAATLDDFERLFHQAVDDYLDRRRCENRYRRSIREYPLLIQRADEAGAEGQQEYEGLSRFAQVVMKKTVTTIILILISVFVCFGQGPQKYTHIKDVIQQRDYQTFRIRAEFAGVYDSSKLIFFVNQDDYIIPIRLQKRDLGAEKRFLAMNLEVGDIVAVKGRLDNILVVDEMYKGLVDAVIIDEDCFDNENGVSVADEEMSIPFQLVEIKPRFNGGDANEFSEWVNAHLKYPDLAKENCVQGRVTLQFTVETDGSLSGVSVLRGVNHLLDEEAIRVVSSSPKWEPGLIKGKPVRVTYTFPVIFQLQ